MQANDGLFTGSVRVGNTLTADSLRGAISTLEAATASTNKDEAVGVGVIKELKTNFQAGVSSIYNAVVAKGVTPSSTSVSDVVTAIGSIGSDKKTVTYLGTGTSFNVTSVYSGYASLTTDNFIVEPVTSNSNNFQLTLAQVWVKYTVTLTKTYNASTGVLTAKVQGGYYQDGSINGQTASVKAYLVV